LHDAGALVVRNLAGIRMNHAPFVWCVVLSRFIVRVCVRVATSYHHRLLNPKKLIEINFTRLAPRMTLARTIKLYKLPDATSSGGWAPQH
jgi:glycylpeptide N-tetradecanoyltransferase